jgi:hypothetical protein
MPSGGMSTQRISILTTTDRRTSAFPKVQITFREKEYVGIVEPDICLVFFDAESLTLPTRAKARKCAHRNAAKDNSRRSRGRISSLGNDRNGGE